MLKNLRLVEILIILLVVFSVIGGYFYFRFVRLSTTQVQKTDNEIFQNYIERYPYNGATGSGVTQSPISKDEIIIGGNINKIDKNVSFDIQTSSGVISVFFTSNTQFLVWNETEGPASLREMDLNLLETGLKVKVRVGLTEQGNLYAVNIQQMKNE
ncbi:hypothetical protein A2382_04020 [Candidatus Woesebacteria bacterium RIFOXYB1_FULL_38_16]|uniref:DUF5666 domain-containing protein n=1 Tax=Candidatus Woesebacteria bacterium RIFOXYB1_FULL_38_16 TaxID=1802538 RepID=A0A1F8CT03_9BACT|nr:MAG: hypothetical protein A2191_00025 [Candidatus Woesebacteria bacterium RIFOXYA1_FULL_38_9]OGM78705.1 MAG: hypothetical protein A2382_04020 [Candidatus Woesebacteria bacterium RIFOXYB1_FULL_38_16]